ncbi:hypothetical protein CLAFUW4_10593 [Fulvia fulva]|uniref:Uncharacterized protein n=1 Tax=Passalora fulva TaxID=5499 RepID=A0A9Q8LFS4_PASFU|nr:uncharacterized protein CLAFUR5_05207 [Fulvia fulva]KAK4616021.1 hypothetical protein CLAFUR4_10598 [Fulvia fulva]KAK4616636.1 hypothetical protein CLAFUR0_10646 [Fulvia fulva]UJO16404.1 hypothetical protein CLAFUR5_05207 [Fulvia fulva]WPV18812.1 hypothetical protein CLAFUW4_10593 [Fulvia fulva]WPV34626.1 hypothetical protein CLAFUW7_10595 [Fulvia fulva]
MYKAVLAGLACSVEPSITPPAGEDRTGSGSSVSRYRAYASLPPTAVHPAFRHWDRQHSEHPQPLQSHSPKSSMSSKTSSEISEIDKETRPGVTEHWNADDFPASPNAVDSGLKRRDSSHSDLTVEEQAQFAHAVLITRAVRKSFHPRGRAATSIIQSMVSA